MNGLAGRICALCGLRLANADGDLCAHHMFGGGDAGHWATGNRIMCDFVHRGIVPPTPPELHGASMQYLLRDLEERLAA